VEAERFEDRTRAVVSPRLAARLTPWPGTTFRASAYRAFRGALASDEPPAVCRSCAVYTGTF